MKQEVKRNERSLNAEILHVLEAYAILSPVSCHSPEDLHQRSTNDIRQVADKRTMTDDTSCTTIPYSQTRFRRGDLPGTCAAERLDYMPTANLMDRSLLVEPGDAAEFVSNILQASTEYSIIGKNLRGDILLWNDGAHRLYGYQLEEMVGRANSSILHTPDDIAAGKPQEIMKIALEVG